MNCLTFKENFESREELAGAMLSHAETCESCRMYADQEHKLDGLFSELADIEAPDTFGMSVRLRIKDKRNTLSGLWASARIAIPVAAMLLIVGFVVISSDLFSTAGPVTNGVAERETSELQDRSDQLNLEGEENPTAETDAVQDGQQLEGFPSTESKPGDPPAPRGTPDLAQVAPSENKRGQSKNVGSIDSADSAFEEVETTNPPGLDPGKPVKSSPSALTKTFTAVEILNTLGVQAVWKAGRLYVTSVSAGGVGFRSGLKKGDHVIALDGRPVSPGGTALGQVKGETLTIRRAGRQILVRIGVRK
ncbi:MAG: hypothetical protein OEM82_12655 [Acidobacteriota bacterium]|nr:hypothetical protein [Acidobacteriota bacterium]